MAGAYIVPSTMHPIAHTQHASSRAVAQFATTARFLRAFIARRLRTSLFTAFAAWFSILSGTSGVGAFFLASLARA